MNSKITIADIVELKQRKVKFTAVSCYDYTAAKLVAQCPVEMILVGDSAVQVVLGYDSTLPATMDFMVTITAAVRRAAPNACLVADMPFLSYQVSLAEAIKNAGRFVVEAGVQIVKVEVTRAQLDVVKAISDAGIAVMAHLGIRPQSVAKAGRLKAEGVSAEAALDLINLADEMVEAGASSILLEGVATEVSGIITDRVCVPVIGCGSGCGCDGQVLIIADILGQSDRMPKFAKSYTELNPIVIKAVTDFSSDVKAETFPNREHSYHMRTGELEELKKMLKSG